MSFNMHDEEQPENLDSWDPLREDFESPMNTLALNPVKDPMSTITGRVTTDVSRIGNVTICDRFTRYNECADGDYCPYLHVPHKFKEAVTNLQESYEANKNRIVLNQMDLSPIEIKPNPKKIHLASVTNAISPTNFYMMLPYESMDFAPYSQEDLEFYIKGVKVSSTAKAKLEMTHKQLAAIYDHRYRCDNLKDQIYPSQIVACKVNGRFRRALVKEVPRPHDDVFTFKLFLIDLGVEVDMQRELIYDIRSECLSEPPIALNCRLNLKPPNGQLHWSDEALAYFEHNSRSDYMCCTILGFIPMDELFTIDLFTTKGRHSLTKAMVEKGYAERC